MAITTLVLTGGAGVVAVVLANGIALAARTDARVRLTALAVVVTLLATPPALAAIGVSRLATQPPQRDWLTRGQSTVALVLGFRFLPVAAVIMMRAVGGLSPSWTEAARVHGVGGGRMLVRVTSTVRDLRASWLRRDMPGRGP